MQSGPVALGTWRVLGEAGISFIPVNVPPFGSEAGSSPGQHWCCLHPFSGNLLSWECTLHPPKLLWQWGRGCPWHSFPSYLGAARTLKPPQVGRRWEHICQKLRSSATSIASIAGNAGLLTPECWVLSAPFPWLQEGRWLLSSSFAHHQRAAHCATRQPVHAQRTGCRRGGGEWGPHRCLPAPSCQLLVAKQLSLFLWRLQRLLLIEEAPTASFSLLLLLLLF